MTPKLPEDVTKILDTINKSGQEAYIVGGCVRDCLMGISPHDWDITTSATPEEVKALFGHTVDTGLAHGTVTVVLHQTNYEITTYRVEGDYTDCRHPSSVSFTRDLHEDLLRRDFTMNAIAYHPSEGFVDLFGGQEDIAAKTIRGVGEANERFQEDALRMLRAVRFATQLDFSIEADTFLALQKNAPLIEKISGERIREELGKTLKNPYHHRLNLLWQSGLLPHLLGKDAPLVLEKETSIIQSLSCLAPHTACAFALFLWPLPFASAKKVLAKWKFDNKTLRTMQTILQEKELPLENNVVFVRRLASRLGVDHCRALLLAKEALGEANAKEDLALLDAIEQNGDCLTVGQLALSGNDLMEMGFAQGKPLGDALRALLEEVLLCPAHNSREWLLSFAKTNLQKNPD